MGLQGVFRLKVWDWTGRRREWFRAASAFTGFHDKLAAELAENELKGCSDVLDAGCGLGLLSLGLCRHLSNITAVDMNEDAIRSLQKDIEEREIKNLRALSGDCYSYSGTHDAVVMCFFRARDFKSLLAVNGKVIRIVALGKSYLSADDGKGRHCIRDGLDMVLKSENTSYCSRLLSLEFGQPLRDMRDAEDFVRMQTPDADGRAVEEYLNERLKDTGDEKYPFYIPHLKEMGIYCIEGVNSRK